MKSYFLLCLMIYHLSNGNKALDSVHCKRKHRNSFLWKLKREPPVYFFGTIHVPYTRVWDYIPTNTRQSFLESENVYFELDLSDVRTGIALSRCKELPLGKEIQEVLLPDIYLRLRRHLNYVRRAMTSWLTSEQIKEGLTAELIYNEMVGDWERTRPIWIMLMINALTEPDIRSRGLPVLDVHLARQAELMGKHTGAIETPEEQCEPFNKLTESQVNFALNQSLLIQEKVREGLLQVPFDMDDMVQEYNCGAVSSGSFDTGPSWVPRVQTHGLGGNSSNDVIDRANGDVTKHVDTKTAQNIQGGEKILDDDTNHDVTSDDVTAFEIDEYLKEELIFRRNERMATRVVDLIKRNEDESFFFAFGAVHFLGERSVIDLLRQKGFKIENVRNKMIKRRSAKVRGSRGQRKKKNEIFQQINERWKEMGEIYKPSVNQDPFFRTSKRHSSQYNVA